MPDGNAGPELWVPIALSEAQAVATFDAVRAAFMAGVGKGDPRELAPLAQAMYGIAQAIDNARDAQYEGAILDA